MELQDLGYDHPVVRELETQVQAEYVRRYGGPDETVMDPAAFTAPLRGAFLVGWVGGIPVAMGGIRAHGDDAEIKRMYVPESQRGKGYARVMLAELEDAAREAGFGRIILETGTAQPEAIALYRSSGYAAIPGFGYYKDNPHNRCFAKLLGPG
jgi:GNAT superfamily N-acetyltransferase